MYEDAITRGTHRLRCAAAGRGDVPVLRRVGWTGDEPSVCWLRHHLGEEELCGLAQHRIGLRAQELAIAIENPVIPHLQCNPDAGGDKDSPSRTSRSCKSPWVRHRVDHPSRSAIHFLRCRTPVFSHDFNQTKKRKLTLPQVAHFGRPVVLLGIDVEVKVVSPSHAAGQAIIPDALQRKRERRISAGSRDRKISAVLKEERQQFGIVRSFVQCFASSIGGLLPRRWPALTEINGSAPVERLIIRNMSIANLCKLLWCGPL